MSPIDPESKAEKEQLAQHEAEKHEHEERRCEDWRHRPDDKLEHERESEKRRQEPFIEDKHRAERRAEDMKDAAIAETADTELRGE